MLEELPVEFGQVIPQPKVRCSQCGRQTMLIAEDDDEPLCSVCRIHDRSFGQSYARDAVNELVVPLEHGGEARAFGRGSGEIGSSELVESMRRDREDEIDAVLCSRMMWLFATFEGLILIGAAAAMR